MTPRPTAAEAERWSKASQQAQAKRAATRVGPHTVYVLRDSDGAVLYIGNTGNLQRRLKEHSKRKHWWREVASTSTHTVPGFDAGHALEVAAIAALRPRYNLLHNPASLYVHGGWDARSRRHLRIAA